MYKQKWNELTYEEKEQARESNLDDAFFVEMDDVTEEEHIKHFEADPDSYEYVALIPTAEVSIKQLAAYLMSNGEMDAFNDAERAAEVIVKNQDYIYEYLTELAERDPEEDREVVNCCICGGDCERTDDGWVCSDKDCDSHQTTGVKL